MENIKHQIYRIPVAVRRFLLRATIMFVTWQLLYNLWLVKTGIPDTFLTKLTADGTAKVLSWFFKGVASEPFGYKMVISIANSYVIGIAAPCNALEIYVLYVAFLFCFPANLRRRLLFILTGIPTIFWANIFRCVLIAMLNIYHSGWVDFSHHYLFTTLVYLLVFGLWVLFTKGGFKNEA